MISTYTKTGFTSESKRRTGTTLHIQQYESELRLKTIKQRSQCWTVISGSNLRDLKSGEGDLLWLSYGNGEILTDVCITFGSPFQLPSRRTRQGKSRDNWTLSNPNPLGVLRKPNPNALSERKQKVPDPPFYLHPLQHLMGSYFGHALSLMGIGSAVWVILLTNKHDSITSLAEVMTSCKGCLYSMATNCHYVWGYVNTWKWLCVAAI